MIFVIIPVHNRIDYTHQCLSSLSKQDTDDYSIIIVDDGSTDGTSEMVRREFPQTILLQGDGSLWWVGSINKGIRYVLDNCQPEDYILSLNDDLIVQTNYFSSLRQAAKEHSNAIIGSVETTMNSPDVIKSGGIAINWKTAKRRVLNKGCRLDQFTSGYSIEVDRLTGRGTMFPAKMFRAIGLYDEVHFQQCGDPELPVRAKFKAGYELFVNYNAVVISQVPKDVDVNTKETYSLSDWREYFFGIRSHFNIRDHFWFAWNVAPNTFWFLRFFLLDLIRTIGHFLLRLNFLRQ